MLLRVLAYLCLALLAGCLFLGTAWKVQSKRLELAQRELQVFTQEVKAKGLAAQKAADKKAKEDKAKKDAIDKKHKTELASFRARIKRLRAHSSGDGVPAVPASTSRPDLICFDRADYKRAYGEFRAEIRGLADEGTENTVALDSAKEWAQ